MSHIVFDSPKFKRWKQRVEVSGNIIKDIKILGFVSRDHINLFGAFLDCKLVTPEGVEIPRCVVIGGDSVVIVPVLTCCENKEVYTLIVEQRRIVDGDYAREFPSGSVDRAEDNLRVIACKELQEELHLAVDPQELFPLVCQPIKIVPSVLDGLVHFFYFKRDVPFSFLKEMDGCSTGCHKDYEYIYVRVIKMSEVVNCLTSSALIGLKLVERALNQVF